MDCARNIITANFSGGTSATTAPLWQWDYGQVLCITGIEDLPAAFEVHFSTNMADGVSTTAVGADGQVTIPNVLLTIGKNLNAWIYLSDSEGEGQPCDHDLMMLHMYLPECLIFLSYFQISKNIPILYIV